MSLTHWLQAAYDITEEELADVRPSGGLASVGLKATLATPTKLPEGCTGSTSLHGAGGPGDFAGPETHQHCDHEMFFDCCKCGERKDGAA